MLAGLEPGGPAGGGVENGAAQVRVRQVGADQIRSLAPGVTKVGLP
jgi:hypothetical protein